jgi:hypothetical protein
MNPRASGLFLWPYSGNDVPNRVLVGQAAGWLAFDRTFFRPVTPSIEGTRSGANPDSSQ